MNDTTNREAFTMLQLEVEGYTTDLYRPDKTEESEADLNIDVRFEKLDEEVAPNCKVKPTIIDVKAPIDPQVQYARKQVVTSIEDQVTTIAIKVKKQQLRAKNKFDESVLYVINLILTI